MKGEIKMKSDLYPGVIAKFNIPDGSMCEIIKYLREDFYLVRTIPEHRELVVYQEDLKRINWDRK